jgi:hypothetical protein
MLVRVVKPHNSGWYVYDIEFLSRLSSGYHGSKGQQSSTKFSIHNHACRRLAIGKNLPLRRNNPTRLKCIFKQPSVRGIEKKLTPYTKNNPIQQIIFSDAGIDQKNLLVNLV